MSPGGHKYSRRRSGSCSARKDGAATKEMMQPCLISLHLISLDAPNVRSAVGLSPDSSPAESEDQQERNGREHRGEDLLQRRKTRHSLS